MVIKKKEMMGALAPFGYLVVKYLLIRLEWIPYRIPGSTHRTEPFQTLYHYKTRP